MTIQAAGASTELAPVDRYELREFAALYEMPLLELGALAQGRSRQADSEGAVTYIVDRNINYTNICVTDCSFCAF